MYNYLYKYLQYDLVTVNNLCDIFRQVMGRQSFLMFIRRIEVIVFWADIKIELNKAEF